MTYLEFAIRKRNVIPGVERHPLSSVDYFLISDQLQDQIYQVDIIPSIQSDHTTLKLKVCGTKLSSKGPSYWKLNNSLLHNKVFAKLLKTEIPKFSKIPRNSEIQ